MYVQNFQVETASSTLWEIWFCLNLDWRCLLSELCLNYEGFQKVVGSYGWRSSMRVKYCVGFHNSLKDSDEIITSDIQIKNL